MIDYVPVITIDGPSGSGKSTLSQGLSARLGWHLLNSGILYRALAYTALDRGVDLQDEDALIVLAKTVRVRCVSSSQIYIDDVDLTTPLSDPLLASSASKVAVLPRVRMVLLDKQRAFREPPGLVAEGRDMGTVVFTDAPLKIFLQASAEIRARRRQKQLKGKGIDVNLGGLFYEITRRDARDTTRDVAPLTPANDAYVLDTTALDAHQVLEWVLSKKARVM